jgi:cyclase
LYKRIISRLDIKNGILVKGISLEGLRNLGDPEYFSQKYYNEKVDEIHFQDVVASLYNRNVLFKIIERNSKKVFVNVSAGGGIKSVDEVDKLLRLGVDKVVINSAAVRNPKILENLVKRYGSSTISVNIETAKISNNYEVLIETGRERTGLDLFKWIDQIQNYQVGEIIVTEIPLEGKSQGYNIQLFEELRKKVSVQLVAHGGAGPLENIVEIFKRCDVDGVSISSLFHYYYLTKSNVAELKGSNYFLQSVKDTEKTGTSIKDLKKYLLSKGVKVRI